MLDPMTGEPAEFLFAARDNRGHPGAFNYYRGTGGHVFIEAAPATLGEHYRGGYQAIPTSEAELATLAKGDAYRLDLVKRLVPRGRFLEIGPWVGLVAYSALKAGYDVSALEMSAQCVELMNSVGIKAVQTDDPAATLAGTRGDGGYDVIGLWHSIEHMAEPWKLIGTAAALVNPGGVLIIAAPNPQSAQFRVLGRHWLHLDAPRHLHLLTIGQYEAIGARHGLVTVEKTTDDQLGRNLDLHGWVHEAHRRVRHIPILKALARRVWRRGMERRHRRPGTLDGAGFTLVMRRPVG